MDGTLSDFQSKKDKKNKKSKNKPVENQEEDKKLLYRSDSAIENVKDLFVEEEVSSNIFSPSVTEYKISEL